MAGNSLYWHDYETWGTDPRRDLPAQFAGLRTDEDLNILGEPQVVYCQPPRDRLPSPEACLITAITPQRAQAKGVSEAEFIAAINKELSWPGTCGAGYNSIRFDDELTRNCLYRNFYDPYEREWRNGNSRWDIIDMVRLTAALRPEGIQWPIDSDGRPSFKLERLTLANGIAHNDAHDALSDVRATIKLARLIKLNQPKLYDYVWRNRTKHEAAALLKLGKFEPVLHVSEKYPSERGCIAVVVALARHPVNQNEIAVYDLGVDPSALLELDADEIRTRLFTRTADLPEGEERIPLKTVHLNKCPVLVPYNTLRPTDAERLQINQELCKANLAKLKNANGLAQKLQAVFTRSETNTPAPDDPDLMIYCGGFFSNPDRQKMTRIREMSPADLANAEFKFDDPRLPEMLFRYRARNWPESLNLHEQERWRAFRLDRLNGTLPGAGLNIREYEERLAALELRTDKHRDKEIIGQLREWGREVVFKNDRY